MRRTPFVRKPYVQKAVARYTGPTTETRHLVWARAQGRCERCGKPITESMYWSVHHRRPRRAGGSRDPRLNEASNLVLLCGSGASGCHGVVESHRRQAMADGWLLSQHADPARCSVRIHGLGVRYLTNEGGYEERPSGV